MHEKYFGLHCRERLHIQLRFHLKLHQITLTGHSAYVATSTESDGVKVDGFLYPNFM